MNTAFLYITPITYGLLVAIWLYIFIFYIRKLNNYKQKDKLLNLLLFILTIDAFRTIFEGVYFGLRYSSSAGFINESVYNVLVKPQYVFLPKFVTLITGILVLIIVLYRWYPTEIKQKLAIKNLIDKKNHDLIKKNHELLEAKEKAEKSDNLKTEFLNNMSHEIRTPMNAIIGFTEILEDTNLSAEKRKYYSKIVNNNGFQLLRVIDDILEIANLETKQEKIIETHFSLNDFLGELYSIFDLKNKDTDISFNIIKKLSDKNSFITTDKTKLNKIISNLLENAFRYTKSGFIELGYNVYDNKLVIYVKDSGIGILSKNHEIIFERFSQEEKEMSRKYGGLGLGLSISKENAKLLGGNITLESEKDKGSTFFVTIPYKPNEKITQNSSGSHLSSINTEDITKCTVLIAEDEEVNFQYLEAVINENKDIDCSLIHAKNGKEAVDICIENKDIDIVLMDIKMPIMNGHQATEKLKSLFPELPIIAQTAFSSQKDIDEAFKYGCNDFLSKPIKKDNLFGMMNKYMHMY